MQVRLIGGHAEVQNMITHLSRHFTVARATDPYPVRSRRRGRQVPGQARVYLEVTK